MTIIYKVYNIPLATYEQKKKKLNASKTNIQWNKNYEKKIKKLKSLTINLSSKQEKYTISIKSGSHFFFFFGSTMDMDPQQIS